MNSGSGLSFQTLDGILLIRFSGSYPGYEQSLTFLQQIAVRVRDSSCPGFLIDSTGVDGMIIGVDRFRLMLSFARMLPTNVSVAVVETRERHIPDYLLETIFRRYEIQGAEFVDRDTAIAWLNRQRNLSKVVM